MSLTALNYYVKKAHNNESSAVSSTPIEMDKLRTNHCFAYTENNRNGNAEFDQELE